MALVEATKLERIHRNGAAVVRALDGVTISIDAGEMTAILGKSGSGKSTLMNLIGGIDRATGGTLVVDGSDLAGLSARALARHRAETVGFVFQSFHLLPRLKAWENVAFPLLFRGASAAERKRRALPLLERVGLAARADHTPSEMSGGEQQRVAIARALVAGPKLLLADEPTGNLDSATSEQIMSLLREVNAGGTTVLFVTHDEELAAANARRVIRMADGRVASDSGSEALVGALRA